LDIRPCIGNVRDHSIHDGFQQHRLIGDVERARILQEFGNNVGDAASLLEDAVGTDLRTSGFPAKLEI